MTIHPNLQLDLAYIMKSLKRWKHKEIDRNHKTQFNHKIHSSIASPPSITSTFSFSGVTLVKRTSVTTNSTVTSGFFYKVQPKNTLTCIPTI